MLVPNRTPWGHRQAVDQVAEGIAFVSTAGHGGFYLDHKRQHSFVNRFPRFVPFAGPGPWYEEDCDAQAIIIAFPKDFPDAVVEVAKGLAAKFAEDDARKWQPLVDSLS